MSGTLKPCPGCGKIPGIYRRRPIGEVCSDCKDLMADGLKFRKEVERLTNTDSVERIKVAFPFRTNVPTYFEARFYNHNAFAAEENEQRKLGKALLRVAELCVEFTVDNENYGGGVIEGAASNVFVICGIHKIISKVKDMVAINQGATKEDLGIKDYPFSKSKKDLKNWKTEDLKNFYGVLVEIYHRSRMESGNELDVALEKLLLSI